MADAAEPVPPPVEVEPTDVKKHRPELAANLDDEMAAADAAFTVREDEAKKAGTDATKPQKQKREESRFNALRKSIAGPADVAARIVADPKATARDVALLFQVISNRGADFYAELFSASKAATLWLLERAAESRADVSPFVHEFVLRASDAGVGAAGWADDVKPLSDRVHIPLLSATELMDDAVKGDRIGNFLRRVQLAKTPEDVRLAATALEAATSLSSAQQALALSRVLSKARRVEGATADASVVTALLQCCNTLCVSRRVAAPPKLQLFVDHAMTNDLVTADHVPIVEALIGRVASGVEDQAESMTTVMTLKMATACDELSDALGNVTSSGEDGVLTLTQTTPDVLSALGVAAAGIRARVTEGTIEADAAAPLLSTVVALLSAASKSAALPRRAQRFIDGERHAQRQAEIKRMRAEDGDGVDGAEQPTTDAAEAEA